MVCCNCICNKQDARVNCNPARCIRTYRTEDMPDIRPVTHLPAGSNSLTTYSSTSSTMPESVSSNDASMRATNVLGTELQPCSHDPKTGFYRTGFCTTGPEDRGSHVVCAQMTESFLSFTKAQGNDLSTPRPAYDFPGLNPGDRWCLCAARWEEARQAGCAPPVVLEATHPAALNVVDLDVLKNHAVTEDA